MGSAGKFLKNFRPVSDLSFKLKVHEKVAAKSVDEHNIMLDNNLHYSVQFAYKERYFTETAFLKLRSDNLTALDSGSGTFLLMLTAFDGI